MAYPSKPTGDNILPFDTIFAENNTSKTIMTTSEILEGYNNDGEQETALTSRPDANRFNMFWYQTHNTIKWIVDYIQELYNAKLEKSGGTMTGILDMGANKVKSTYKPVNNEDLTNKEYVDKAINSGMWLGEVKALSYPSIPQLASGVEIVEADGRALSRTEYAEYFSLIGVAYGAGDGSTTFNIPDYRGMFLRGWRGSSNRDGGRAFGSVQNAGAPNIKGVFDVTNNWPTRAFGDGTASPRGTGAFTVINRWGTNAAGNGGTGAVGVDFDFNASRSSSVYQNGLTEVRPINSTVYYVIRIK